YQQVHGTSVGESGHAGSTGVGVGVGDDARLRDVPDYYDDEFDEDEEDDDDDLELFGAGYGLSGRTMRTTTKDGEGVTINAGAATKGAVGGGGGAGARGSIWYPNFQQVFGESPGYHVEQYEGNDRDQTKEADAQSARHLSLISGILEGLDDDDVREIVMEFAGEKGVGVGVGVGV
ncbi:hypothetical protein HK102_006262, partial [Quaeritorhiza haematococci]